MVEILDCRLSDEHSYDDQDKGARQPIAIELIKKFQCYRKMLMFFAARLA
jgi:hypothetical protein